MTQAVLLRYLKNSKYNRKEDSFVSTGALFKILLIFQKASDTNKRQYFISPTRVFPPLKCVKCLIECGIARFSCPDLRTPKTKSKVFRIDDIVFKAPRGDT